MCSSHDVRDRLADLERDRTAKIAELRSLDTTAAVVEDAGLLDQLPQTVVELNRLPVELQRELFDALQLRIRYDSATGMAAGQITLGTGTNERLEAIPGGPSAARHDVHVQPPYSCTQTGSTLLRIQSNWTV